MIVSKRNDVWIVLAIGSLLAACFAYQYIDQVLSLVNLSITADRHQILADAQRLAGELGWNLAGYKEVTSFDSQDELQSFVELEAGGKDAFVEMFQSDTYHPYRWHVRFFKEKEVSEMHVWFSPQGKRIGFFKKISEQAPGINITKPQAWVLIEQQIYSWCSNFKHYKLIEYDCKTQDTGRLDHKFTYERTDKVIGKGFYRLEVKICGDVITSIQPKVKIPDNFNRRYQEMRSANNLLAQVGSFLLRFLYFLCFGLLGLLFFYRRKYLLVTSSALAAAIVAGGSLLRGLNDLPLWWMSYNTVQNSTTFLITKFASLGLEACFLLSIMLFCLVVAEAAGRFVYQNHLQFFKNFHLQAMQSQEVFQQVALAYLMVPFMFAYVVVFGYVTKTYYGWWSPAGSLSDPNILASYFPWLGALTISFQAGFFEEVAFRALPLAMTAVLTKNSQYKKVWTVGIFILQALIFSACHANYPNQPFYARLLEIIVPSFGFGWMYLKFGLLPGIITHFVYDVVWFAMPIFASTLVVSKLIIVIMAGLPLLFVCASYVYYKKLDRVPADYYNRAYQQSDIIPFAVQTRNIGKNIPELHKKLLLLFGLSGLIVWGMTHQFKPDTQSLYITKAQAIEAAAKAVHDSFGVNIDTTSWSPVVIDVTDISSTATRFIWQVYGKDIYHLACGTYLDGVALQVRFVRFSGAVEDRAEEYCVVVTSRAENPLEINILKAAHKIPEHFIGADIEEEQAQHVVNDFIEKMYNLSPQDTKLISVTSDKLDTRRDWTIVMQDTQIFDFGRGGQARIKVKISGDQVTEYTRFIFVPEDWTRNDQERLMSLGLIKGVLFFLFILLLGLGFFCAIPKLLGSRYGVKILQHKGAFVASVACIYALNSIEVSIGLFTTAEPFYDQFVRTSLSMISLVSANILLYSIILSAGAVGLVKSSGMRLGESLLLSTAGASLLAGTVAFLSCMQPSLEPIAGHHGSIVHWASWIALSAGSLKIFYILLASATALFMILQKIEARWPHLWWMQFGLCIIFCFGLQAIQQSPNFVWIMIHTLVGACILYGIYYCILKYNMTLLPLIVAGFVVFAIIPELIHPSYYRADFDALVAIGLMIVAALFCYERACHE